MKRKARMRKSRKWRKARTRDTESRHMDFYSCDRIFQPAWYGSFCSGNLFLFFVRYSVPMQCD